MKIEQTVSKCDIICPSCKARYSAIILHSILKDGFKCEKCGYHTEPNQTGNEKLIVELLNNKKLIDAVKLQRAITDKGLKEAKSDVEEIAKRNNIDIKTGCFIATACYGSDSTREVMILRKYRDEILEKSFAGRLFIRLYYAVSPSIARSIQNSERIKTVIRINILSPITRRISSRFEN